MSPSWLKKTTSASQGHDCSSRLDRLIKRTGRERETEDEPWPLAIESSSTSLVRRRVLSILWWTTHRPSKQADGTRVSSSTSIETTNLRQIQRRWWVSR